MKNYKRT